MTIVALKRLHLFGLAEDRDGVLGDLQDLGVVHLEPARPVERRPTTGEDPFAAMRDALAHLLAVRRPHHQVRDAGAFDPVAVQRAALANRDRLLELKDERDGLIHRIGVLEPFGEFTLPPDGALDGRRLWFYSIPHYQMRRLKDLDAPWAEVGRDNRYVRVVVISPTEPPSGPGGVPVPRAHVGSHALSALRRRLDQVELAIDDTQADRESLSRWCHLFARSLARLEDRALLDQARGMAAVDGPLVHLVGWVPVDRAAAVERVAEDRGLAVILRDPVRGEEPPTLMHNPDAVAGGQDLVGFYSTPAYRDWDPSAVVFVSFALFFAMIVSDAGYAAVFAIPLAAVWGRMAASAVGRRLRRLFAWVLAAAAVWGVLVGSYFGLSPPPASLPARVAVIDLTDYEAMMRLAVLAGVGHVAIANLLTARHRWPDRRAAAPLGWVAMLLGGVSWWLTGGVAFGATLAVAGAVAVLAFTKPDAKPLDRLLAGVIALAGLPSAFGDVLSYLRLFALGLASASLAMAFNDLARQAMAGVPGLGVLLALLILVVGHGLNLALALMSGVVHGLRLNFIEFFRWSLSGEGRPFRAFARKAATFKEGSA